MQLQFLEHLENKGEWSDSRETQRHSYTLLENGSVARLLTTVPERIKLGIILKL